VLPRASSGAASLALVGAFVAGLALVSLYLRTLALGDAFWMDEALSVGIAEQPLSELPGVLRGDGAPPLYYALLHFWIDAVGDTMGQTHALSVVLALVAIPAALWAGWSLFGRRAGLIAATLAAFNPYLTLYAVETRMYSLMVLLCLLATACFVHAFVYRRRGYLLPFAVLLAALLYTHNWGIFVGIGFAGGAVAAIALAAERPPLVRDALLSFGGTGLLYLPWVPTLLYQAGHTGAPWLNPPRFGAPVQIAKSMLGGGAGTGLLILGAGAGLAGMRGRASRERTAAIVLLVLPVVMLGSAWLISQFSPAWTTRYLGVVLGPLLLVAALGFARAGRVGLLALAAMLVIWIIPHTYDPKNKSNAQDIAFSVAGAHLTSNDLVIVTQPEQVPLMRYHLGPTPRYASVLGPHDNPQVMDWRDGIERMEASRPTTKLEPLIATLPRNGRVLLVRPVPINADDWDAPWTRIVRRRSAQWGLTLDRHPGFVRRAIYPDFYRYATRIGVRAVLYEKTR
jgi:4-amino-4-deoxy-L-arabinose transferase-like glycosyltransferase